MNALGALVAYGLWALLLLACVLTARMGLVVSGKFKANGFTPGEKHGPPIYWRLNRAHINAVELLPIFAAVSITGFLMGCSGAFDGLATVVVMARVWQSTLHVLSEATPVVLARFCFMCVQVAAVGVMALQALFALSA